MKFKKLLLLSAAAFSITQAQAGVFNVSNVLDGNSEILYATDSTTLASSGIATIGYFTAGFDPSLAPDIASMITAFTVVNSAPIGQAPSLGVGSFAGYAEQATSTGVSVGNVTGANPLLGRMVYTFVGNGADLGSSTAFILFSVGAIQDDVPVEFDYSTLTPVNVVLGTPGSYVGNASGLATDTTEFRTLIMIPEPSSALLGAVGALALLRRRRA